jgi:hypothetical protein
MKTNKVNETNEKNIINEYETGIDNLEDNFTYREAEAIRDEIDYLSSIDWTGEEYIPYNIDPLMDSESIKTYLYKNYIYEISIDLNCKMVIN